MSNFFSKVLGLSHALAACHKSVHHGPPADDTVASKMIKMEVFWATAKVWKKKAKTHTVAFIARLWQQRISNSFRWKFSWTLWLPVDLHWSWAPDVYPWSGGQLTPTDFRGGLSPQGWAPITWVVTWPEWWLTNGSFAKYQNQLCMGHLAGCVSRKLCGSVEGSEVVCHLRWQKHKTCAVAAFSTLLVERATPEGPREQKRLDRIPLLQKGSSFFGRKGS